MKLAMVMLTKNDDSGLVVNGENMERPLAISVTHRNLRICLLLLLACAAAFAAASWWYSASPAPAHTVARSNAAPSAGLLVQDWHGSEPIARGERVLASVRPGGPVGVQVVAAVPNETVVLRHGADVRTLVLLGPNKYYVTAANGAGYVINADQIRGKASSSVSSTLN